MTLLHGSDLTELFPIIPYDPSIKPKLVPWLVDGMFQLGKINAVFGFEKAGKSRLLTWLMLHAWHGKPVWDIVPTTQPRRTLWLAGEEQPEDIIGRIQRQAAFAGFVPAKLDLASKLSFMPAAGLRMDQESYRVWLADEIKKGGYDTIIVDPLRRVHGGDENDNTMMSRIYNDWRKWTNDNKWTIIIVHHTGHKKDDAQWERMATWSRGATDLPAILDAAIFVERQTQRDLLIRRQGRYAPRPPFKLEDGNDEEFAFRLKLGEKV